jgi:hypothetical protein
MMVLIRAIRLSRWSVSGGSVNDCGKPAYSASTRPSFEVTGSVGIGS